jgi:hypothetical protein
VAIIHGFLAVVLLFGSACTREWRLVPGQDQAEKRAVELTSSHPEATFAVSQDTLTSSPAVLALSFTRVVNPNKTPFLIFVYLSYRPGEKTDILHRRILLGNGSLYPPELPGGFRLRVSAAFAKLKAEKATDVQLVLEMKRIHPGESWSQLKVTVAPPQWRGENG